MNDCVFCKIIKGEMPADKIYEDENYLAFLDITPINPGHTLLMPKKHYKNLYSLPNDVLNDMALLIKKIAVAVKQAVSADGINIGMNNEQAAGQIVPHVHFHVIPRFLNDGHRHWHGKQYPPNKSKEIAEQIKKFL
ncbi:MAG: HIT family protein [Patescibacteria group bacterium]